MYSIIDKLKNSIRYRSVRTMSDTYPQNLVVPELISGTMMTHVDDGRSSCLFYIIKDPFDSFHTEAAL